jgi:hypothetical protein
MGKKPKNYNSVVQKNRISMKQNAHSNDNEESKTDNIKNYLDNYDDEDESD